MTRPRNKNDKRTIKIKKHLPNFKSISDKLKDAEVSPEFWKKEQENILKAARDGKKMKESMRMTPEKFHQPFTI